MSNDEGSSNAQRRKAMRGLIALQKRFARNEWKGLFSFRAALGVRARPRAAFAGVPSLSYASVNFCSPRAYTDLDFWRRQKSPPATAGRIQSRSRPLRSAEQDDHVRPNQRAAREFAG